jgi:hypothetical protein
MALARQTQSSTMLYTVITFVALFIIAAILAVIFYLKSEDWRDQYLASQRDTAEFASQNQVRNIGSLVGQKERNQSRLSQLLGYIDQLYVMFVGIQPQETSAEVKMTEMQAKYKDVLAKLPQEMTISADANDTNGPGAVGIIAGYDNKLKQKQELADQLTSQLADLNSEYDLARQGAVQREEDLRTQIRSEQEKADSVQQSYDQLRELMDKKATEQVQTLMQQRDQAVDEKNKARQELQAALSKLTITQNRLEEALSRLDVLKPRPKEDIAAYKPDGHIITVDASANIVFIDIGNEDKVYPGLTFSVYDRNASVTAEDTSKAEIEVFNVDKNTAAARINKSNKKNPVAEGDIIINLIWDSRTVNRFIVAGEFDFNGDGNIDPDGAEKIKQLIENWGGKVEDVVTIDTDFVVLGTAPQVKKKPTLDEIQTDPMANEKYEASLRASEQYQEIKNQAKDLYIPVFNLKRFMNFIGYESLAGGTKAK